MATFPQSLTVDELAEYVGGVVFGPRERIVNGPGSLEQLTVGGVVFATDPKWVASAIEIGYEVLLVPPQSGLSTVHPTISFVEVPDPKRAFHVLLSLCVRPHPVQVGIHPSACVDPAATVDPEAAIGAFVVVERGAIVESGAVIYPYAYVGVEAHIGRNCVMYPHAVAMAEVVMQADSVLHPHAVLGSAGFGYVPENGEHIPIPQVGTVVLGEKAEVGAGSTVDRATAGSTVIGRGTKLDNLVMVGHNCQIGEHCILVSQVGLGGSSILGDRVIMAGQSGMADHTRICDGAVILSRAAVTEDVTEPGQYSGFPARSAPEERRSVAAYRKLPDLLRRVRKLEKGGTD